MDARGKENNRGHYKEVEEVFIHVQNVKEKRSL